MHASSAIEHCVFNFHVAVSHTFPLNGLGSGRLRHDECDRHLGRAAEPCVQLAEELVNLSRSPAARKIQVIAKKGSDLNTAPVETRNVIRVDRPARNHFCSKETNQLFGHMSHAATVY